VDVKSRKGKKYEDHNASIFFKISYEYGKENVSLFFTSEFVIHRKEGRINEENLSPAILESTGRDMQVNGEKLKRGQKRILVDKDVIQLEGCKMKFTFLDNRKGVNKDQYSDKVLSRYHIGEQLGQSGINGAVRLALDVRTMGRFAIKSISLLRNMVTNESSVAVRDVTAAENEINIMRQLKHPNIVRLEKWIEDTNYAHLVIEEMDNGDLLQHICSSPDGFLIEPEGKRLTFQISQGLKYLHDKVIGHGDIKLENIFIKKNAGGGLIYKLGDFGLSVLDINIEKYAGTPQYAAPEIFISPGPISVRKSDLWSLGVLIYTCLRGLFPYEYAKLQKHIR
jgi:hypothetical protein